MEELFAGCREFPAVSAAAAEAYARDCDKLQQQVQGGLAVTSSEHT